MKLAVLGGGGVRSPFLAKSIALGARSIGITETVFMDIDEEKLFIYQKQRNSSNPRRATCLGLGRHSLTNEVSHSRSLY